MRSTRIKYLTNVFFDSKIYPMSPETLKFLHDAIRTYTVSVNHDETGSEYSIEMESGAIISFSCDYVFDDKNRPGRHYCITLNWDEVADGFCLDGKQPTQTTKQIIDLIRKCSNKILAQEMKSRQNGILNQIGNVKTYN